MHLVFELDESNQRVIGRFRLGPEYQGGDGFIHGGIIATVLDEVMSKVSRFSDVRAVTAELTCRISEAGARGRGVARRRLFHAPEGPAVVS